MYSNIFVPKHALDSNKKRLVSSGAFLLNISFDRVLCSYRLILCLHHVLMNTKSKSPLTGLGLTFLTIWCTSV